MMNNELWEKRNYLLDIPYVIAHNIYEYDIRKANINVLYSIGEIDKDYYDKLNSMDRMNRQVEIGYLLKYNTTLYDKLSNGIKHYRKLLFESNNLEDNDILSIKNDAIFVINKRLRCTKFGNVEFILKNEYTTYIKLISSNVFSNETLEVYFKSDSVTNNINLDIKGISESNLEYHMNYMCTVIADTLYYIETGNLQDALIWLTEIYNKYIRKELHPGFFRNFNGMSDYTIIANSRPYSIKHCTSREMFDNIDISCNLNIIRELYGYVSSIYFQNNKKR